MLLGGGKLENATARVPLNAPIVVEVKDWTPATLTGRAADGRAVSLAITPAVTGEARIDAAILVDHSGSMAQSWSGTAPISKHAAVLLGLNDAHRHLTPRDRLDLWEFDTTPRHIGKAGASDWRTLVPQLSGPNGGTEIGSAIDAVIASSARDILLVTDGMSHALDVQALARPGARITVVLIGDDSLEARVGHLAVLTGGEIFVAEGGGRRTGSRECDRIAADSTARDSTDQRHRDHDHRPPLRHGARRYVVTRAGFTPSR